MLIYCHIQCIGKSSEQMENIFLIDFLKKIFLTNYLLQLKFSNQESQLENVT